MSLRSLFDRSRDALYAFAASTPVAVAERVEDMGAGHGHGHGVEHLGWNGIFGGSDLRNLLFWAAIVVVLLLLGESPL